MIDGSPRIRQLRRSRRRGLTFAELIVATTIMVLIASAVATLGMAVHSTNSHCQGQITAAQHARIVLQRIQEAVEEASSSVQFPVCVVVAEQAGGQQLPDTLVVWRPLAAAASPAGMPQICELVVFAPDPTRPSNLLEIRSPTDTSPAPPTADTAAWQTLVNQMKTSQSTEKVVLTDRLRTTPVTGSWSDSLTAAQLRGVIRFRRLMAPSDQEWAQYRGGSLAWNQIHWPLDSYRSKSGTRTVACQTEMQIMTGSKTTAASTALPFFGSASFSYELQR